MTGEATARRGLWVGYPFFLVGLLVLIGGDDYRLAVLAPAGPGHEIAIESDLETLIVLEETDEYRFHLR